MKRKQFQKLLAVTAVIASMALVMAGCGEEPEGVDPGYVEQLESECVDLRNQNQNLENQLGDLEQSVVLKSYTLKATADVSGQSAVVAITAAPMRYEEGQKATFRVIWDGKESASAEGKWDGSIYTASVTLPAEDGYEYVCILTQPDGAENEIILSSPENPLYESCVYLASALNTYCNLFVEDWSQEGDRLTLVTGYAQVQLPRIGDGAIQYASSDLVLKMGDAELERIPVDMPEGEAKGSREMVLENISFSMPEIDDAQQVELWLEVSLSDGQVLTYNGCSWFYADGVLALAVG